MNPVVKRILAASVLFSSLNGVSAFAADVPCAQSLYSMSGVQIISTCAGFFSDNHINNSSDVNAFDTATINRLLGSSTFALGSKGGNGIEKLNKSGYTTTVVGGVSYYEINFAKSLVGDTVVGFHFGEGKDGHDEQEGGTAFYRFDAGSVGLDSFLIRYSGTLTAAAIYKTAVVTGGTIPAVPEPVTYGMLLTGLGLLGFMARRRKLPA